MMNNNQQDLEFRTKPQENSKKTVLSQNLHMRAGQFLSFLRKNPKLSIMGAGILILSSFFFFSDSDKKIEKEIIDEQRISREVDISGVKQAVDPRANWTADIISNIDAMKKDLESLIEQKADNNKVEIENLKQQIEILENNREQDNYLQSETVKEEEITTLPANKTEIEVSRAPRKRRLGFIQRDLIEEEKNVEDYVISGSFARATVTSGVVVGTGILASETPEPITLKLVDGAIFSKGYRTEQIKGAVLHGSCTGNINSERAKCRLEKISLVNKDGKIIEKPVEGWLIGEDGRNGLRGDVYDKSSEVVRMAILNGVLSGMAQFFQNQATSSVFPISPFTGQQNALTGSKALQGGMYAGAGNALDEFAKFTIKRAEQMSPIIVIKSTRTIDVVFKKGFSLKSNFDQVSTQILPSPTATNYNNSSNSVNRRSNFSAANAKLKQRFIKESQQGIDQAEGFADDFEQEESFDSNQVNF